MDILVYIACFLFFYAMTIIPRVLLSRQISIEEERRTNPRFKGNFAMVLPMLIPFVGGGILCEQMGFRILKIISWILGATTVLTWIVVLLVNFQVITGETIVIASMYINVANLLLTYLVWVIIAFRSAKIFESGWAAVLCILPFLSYLVQTSSVHRFFVENNDI